MIDHVAGAISFFAFGANLIGTIVLLLFNPRSHAVRWYAAFQLMLLVWLFSQGMTFSVGNWEFWAWPFGVAMSVMPGLFLASAIVDKHQRSTRGAVLATAIGILLIPAAVATLRGTAPDAVETIMMAWQVVGWGGATVVMWRGARAKRVALINAASLERLVLITLLLIAPVSIIIAHAADGRAFFVYVMPIVTVLIQVLIFFGVSRLRFYDIEVRAARTGELAATAAEHERLAVLGELAATIAHEVRNPLTGVRSLAQRIAEEEVPAEKRRRYADVILEEVGRLERIVSNLLDASKRSRRGEWDGTQTALQPLFDDLVLLTSGRANRTGVSVTADAHGQHANAPREALAQALLNLMLNAVRHSPAGATVEVSARQSAHGTSIVVRDHGPGVPAEEREHIFEPFQSTSGTGLGLSVVRSLARDFEWQLSVGDAPGGGAEFTIVVPTLVAAGNL